jgi:uncharacterized iron-regulated membrane protein
LRAWDVAHRWSSLACTVFLFLLCATGLPLIFLTEIDHATGVAVEPAAAPPGSATLTLDRVARIASARHPDAKPLFASHEAHDVRVWYVTLGPAAGAVMGGGPLRQVAVDGRTGEVLSEPVVGHRGVLGVLRSLHVDLFAGLPGQLFLGVMGLLFLISLLSGVILYAPFMRKMHFGTVRVERGARVRWLDLHNLIGIATLVWAIVVGATGAINTCADLLVEHWQSGQLQAMLAVQPAGLESAAGGGAQRAVDAARAREPDREIGFVAFPGTSFSSPLHFGVYMRGTTALTARLVKPVLVEAASGVVTESGPLPWYLKALFLSQPLHFGDYGGLPLKILWALLDVATLLVLGSGVYLWIARLRPA